MLFQEPLQEGRFLRRYKRFFAEIEWRGQTIVAHVPNTGSLKSCLGEGWPCLFSENRNPARKLKFTLQMIKTPSSWVGVNTALSNQLVWEAWHERRVKAWASYGQAQQEVKITSNTRIDMALWRPHPEVKKFHADLLNQYRFHFVEIKNVTLGEGACAQFPDAVTERGQKHLRELISLIDQGHSAEILFTVQRSDCRKFRPADAIDPDYGRLLRKAQKKGVVITPFSCIMTAEEIRLDADAPLETDI